MTERPDTHSEPWKRVIEALERVERAGAQVSVRRTAAEFSAETSAPVSEPAAAESDQALKAENHSLRQQLEARDQTIAALRREAARLAGLVDNALTQLDTIQEG